MDIEKLIVDFEKLLSEYDEKRLGEWITFDERRAFFSKLRQKVEQERMLSKVQQAQEQKPIHAKPSLYAFYFSIIKEIGLRYGYNIVLHGSMNRDLDLIAIPWEGEIGDKDLMIDEIAGTIGGVVVIQNRSKDDPIGRRFGLKPHGRAVYIININRDFEMKFNGVVTEVKDYADPQYYIDISVLPEK